MNKGRRGRRAGVRIAQFKAHMGHYLREVRKGYSITILDRDHPVATVTPCVPEKPKLTIRKPVRKWGSIVLPPPLEPGVPDSLTILLEDRNRDRT